MPFHLDFGPWGRIFPVPAALADQHLKFCTEAQLKVLLLVLRHAESPVELADIALRLGLTEAEVQDCLLYWEESGLFSLREAPAAPESAIPAPLSNAKKEEQISGGQKITTLRERSHLTPGEINDLLRQDAQFPALLEELERCRKELLSPTERETVAYLYRFLKLSPDYILVAAAYCRDKGKKSLRYLEKTIAGWVDDGIDTYEKAEAHLHLLAERQSDENRIRRLFGLGERALTAKEKTCLTRWCEECHTSDALLKLAYDRAVEATGKVSFAYIDKIVGEWYRKGIATPEEADRERSASVKAAVSEHSFDIAEAIRIMEQNSNE